MGSFIKTQACMAFLFIGWLFVIPTQAQPTEPTDIDMKLIFAIYNGKDVDTIANLIRGGANVNAATSNGSTPLHYAAAKE